MELVADAARSLRGAPRLQALAATVAAGVRARSGSAAYNGLHLRLERDSGYVEAWGGEEARPLFLPSLNSPEPKPNPNLILTLILNWSPTHGRCAWRQASMSLFEAQPFGFAVVKPAEVALVRNASVPDAQAAYALSVFRARALRAYLCQWEVCSRRSGATSPSPACATVKRSAVQQTRRCWAQALWKSYSEAMSSVGFRDDRPLYLASGLTTYLNASGAHR